MIEKIKHYFGMTDHQIMARRLFQLSAEAAEKRMHVLAGTLRELAKEVDAGA